MDPPGCPSALGVHLPPSVGVERSIPIAIVGIGCRLPGDISSPSHLWDFLAEGRSGLGEVPKSRFNNASYIGGSDEPATTRPWGGYFLREDIRNFDNEFFGISNREAAVMDPQQRKVLEVVFESLESAGVTLDEVSGANVGVYMASFSHDYIALQTKDPNSLTLHSHQGMGVTILGNRISHVFNLKGPSCTLDTACSSSLYALHLACTALQNGDCDAAVVAGVNLIQSPDLHIAVSQGGVLSPTSQCHTFDASADGYARADGVNAIYIKRLDDAIRNHDVVRSIIRGTATNSNGRTPGIAQPSIDGQEAVVRKAYARAGLDPGQTAYVETHGTGTKVGDPVEVEALSRVFRKYQRASATLLGSVKPNLGHGEATSGLSSLIKATLALEHKKIPATIGVKNINPAIRAKEWGVEVVTRMSSFPQSPGRHPHRISVSSFGYGGANAHAILEEATCLPNQVSYTNGWTTGAGDQSLGEFALPYLLPFSANHLRSLEGRVERLSHLNLSAVSLQDLAYTLGERRSHLARRGYVIAHPKTMSQDINVDNLRLSTTGRGLVDDKLAFVFTGQGAQWKGMARQLLHFPTFADTVRQLDADLSSLPHPPDWRIFDILLDDSDCCPINQAAFAQPITTAVQIGLVTLLRSWSIRAEAVIGHSSGEIAAAYAAGLLSTREAIILAYYRGYAVTQQAPSGAMAAIGLNPKAALDWITQLDLSATIQVACINSPSSVTISGDREGIETIIAALQADGIFARILKTDGKAYHSHHMASVGKGYEQLLVEAAIFSRDESTTVVSHQIPMYSTVFCKPLEYQLARTTTYWRSNLESPVRFCEGLTGLSELVKHPSWVEIGPHAALKLPIMQTLGQSASYVSSLDRGQDSAVALLNLIGRLFVQGFKVDFSKLLVSYPHDRNSRFIYDLPTYAWHYAEPLWNESRTSRESRHRQHPRHELLGAEVPGGSPTSFSWRNLLCLDHVPWLREHRLGDTAVFPATGYIAMALEALVQKGLPAGVDLGHECVVLRDVALVKALPLEDEGSVELFTELRRLPLSNVRSSMHWWEFQISTIFEDSSYAIRAKGLIRLDSTPDSTYSIPSSNCDLTPQSRHLWYGTSAQLGLEYGPTFQQMYDIQTPDCKGVLYAEARTQTLAPDIPGGAQPHPRYFLHPVLLDTILQVGAIACNGGSIQGMVSRVPTHLGEIRMRLASKAADDGGSICAISTVTNFNKHHVTAALVDHRQAPVAQFTDVEMTTFVGPKRREARYPIGRVNWKPDITQIPDDSAFSSALTRVLAVTNLGGFEAHARFLAALNLIVHKQPDCRILSLTTDLPLVALCLVEVLDAVQVHRRFETFSLGRIGLDGMLEVADIRTYSAPLELSSVPFRKATPDDQFGLCILGDGMAVADQLGSHTNDRTFFLGPNTAIVSLLAGSHLPLTDSTHRVQVLRPVVKFTPTFSQIILIGAESVDSQLAEYLSADSGLSVQALSLYNLLACSSPITPQTLVVSTIELHRSVLADPTSEEFDALKQIIEHAAHLVWITGCGVHKGFDPTQSLFIGLARALVIEQPMMKIVSLQLDPATEVAVLSHDIMRIVRQEGSVDCEFIRDGSHLLISRIVPDEQLNRHFQIRQDNIACPTPLSQAGNASLSVPEAGPLSTAQFVRRPPLGPLATDHVLVKVACFGLNAKDVYALTGRVPTKDATCGFELTGHIVDVGDKVRDESSFTVGDRVAVMYNGHFSPYEAVPAWSCVKLQESEDLSIMAGVLVAFVTAVYALEHRAHLEQGESILIHSAAGAVGMATIQLAQHLGAGEIYATVGTAEKKHFLVERFGLRPENVFSSRSTEFAAQIQTHTQGRGVDVVLNSLVGDLLHESWECLAEWGRFVEIGKRDILDSGRLDMRTLLRGTTFTAFDLGMLGESTSTGMARQLTPRLLSRVMSLLRAGHVKPIQPLTVFPVRDLTAAFNHFNNAKRMGKIVISFEDPTQMVPVVPERFSTTFSPAKSYLLVGCLGGLGRSLSRWMMSRGARRFVFLGRTGLAKPAARLMVEQLEQAGAHCTVMTGDVSLSDDVERAVATAMADAPLGGVVQAAMGLHEAIFKYMPRENWLTGTQAKVRGTWNLHHALGKLGCEADLDFFLLTSSIAGQLGTATEGNYCAANHFLDVFARYRYSLGLRAISLGLGSISEIGYLHEHSDIGDLLLRKGIRPLPEHEVLQVIDIALSSEQHQTMRDPLSQCHILTGIEDTGLQEHRKQGYTGFWQCLDDPRFSVLTSALQRRAAQSEGAINTPASVIQTALVSGDEAQLRTAVTQAIAKKMSNIILLPLPRLDLKVSLGNYGMDSMLAAELRQYIFSSMDVDVPFLMLMDAKTTVMSVVELVVEQLGKRWSE
ncbi:ketoacyl-synt-domain-containing protein [Aspergillus sclerotioniger CBS 115572]|uniref:Ketoacyl-synt-domain-containing protein n=1 Tax=Aspergillus sclerotioniger CBS 115572 TaxID=1450535 RepID=A0A317W6D7_9EURO|nr:ketoacyl-synt-domain-containing protein [Aspergillus sclerotioniger CBS 115572]PWY80872.1 ketoacyl-synt-domain-containing protein [Aspergillus sclerotioniger CBS 115572]